MKRDKFVGKETKSWRPTKIQNLFLRDEISSRHESKLTKKQVSVSTGQAWSY